jgi:hypothetical protein
VEADVMAWLYHGSAVLFGALLSQAAIHNSVRLLCGAVLALFVMHLIGHLLK